MSEEHTAGMLEAVVEAALGGHDLGEWLPVPDERPITMVPF